MLLDGIDESTSRAIEVSASACLQRPTPSSSCTWQRRSAYGMPGRHCNAALSEAIDQPIPSAPLPCLHFCSPNTTIMIIMQARHSYGPSDIRWRHHFDPCIQRRQSGRLGVDFSIFDSTTQLGEDEEEEQQQQQQGNGAAEWTTPSSAAAAAGGSMLPAMAGGGNGAAAGAALPGGLFVPSPHRSAFQSPAPALAPPPV